ncbi:VQ motif-containing protein 17-like [Musa acuminata AAA Group]|uniref:VQ motif-containing protein 17-like n=1 Tax=Musa acuminata AAA Group TaxID=214697 RepID=UPI0031D24CB6
MKEADIDRPALLTPSKDSHVMSKLKPKIRIVHLFAPEIIKTDAENFRELVQRLTGKPTKAIASKKKKKKKKKKASPPTTIDEADRRSVRGGHRDLMHERVKEETTIELSEDDIAGFFSELGAAERFFGDPIGDFPLLPVGASFT